MKKSNLLLTALMSLTLASCGAANDTSFNLKDWSPKLIDQNLVDEDKLTNNVVNYSGCIRKAFNSGEVYDASYAEYGLLVIKTSDDKLGFYSLTYNDWLVSPITWTYSNSYTISINSYVGYILYLKIGASYYCYDGLGNEIFADSAIKDRIYIQQSSDGEEKIYCSYESTGTIKYYNEKGVLGATALSEDSNPHAGDKFVDPGLTNTYEEIEVDDYKFSIDLPIVTVYDKDGDYKASYSVPYLLEMASGQFFAGTSLIYQVVNPVASDAKDYDLVTFSNGGPSYAVVSNKYVVNSYKLDLLTGNNKEINLDYVIADEGEVFKDKNGETNYSLVPLVFIGKDKTTKNAGEYLVDDNGTIIANATGLEAKRFIKLNNGNYYNLSTKILYTSKLKVIAHLDNINPVYYRGIGFVGSMNGKYGVVGEDGVISLAFEYDYINNYSSNDYVYAVQDNNYYRINLKAFSVEIVAETKDVTNYGKGLFGISRGTSIIIGSASNDYYYSSNTPQFIGNNNFYFGDYMYFYSSDNNNVEFVTFAAKEVANREYFTSKTINYVVDENEPSLNNKYIITNDETYPFNFDGYAYTSTNKDSNSKSTLTITALGFVTFSFAYLVSSESGYDCLTFSHNGYQIESYSGENSGFYSIDLALGDEFKISYSKDSSGDSGEDQIAIADLRFN